LIAGEKAIEIKWAPMNLGKGAKGKLRFAVSCDEQNRVA